MQDNGTDISPDAASTRPVAVVVPCYNEAARLPGQSFVDYAAAHPDIGFLFIDDGSTDQTAARLAELAARSPLALRVLRLPANAGKAEAVRTGVLAAMAAGAVFVGYWDADLSTPLEEIEEFQSVLEERPDLVAVLGSRIRRLGARVERDAMRHYAGRIFATFASLVLGLPVYDTQCGAKLFRAGPDVRRAFDRPFLSRWIFDVEVLSRLTEPGSASADGHTLCEKPLQRWRDVPGSKLRFHHAIGAIGELWQIERERRIQR